MIRHTSNYKCPHRPVFDSRNNEPIDLTQINRPEVGSFRAILFQGLHGEHHHPQLLTHYDFALEALDYLITNFHTTGNREMLGLNQHTEVLLYKASQDLAYTLKKVDFYTTQFEKKDRSPAYFSSLMEALKTDFDGLDESFHNFLFTHYSVGKHL